MRHPTIGFGSLDIPETPRTHCQFTTVQNSPRMTESTIELRSVVLVLQLMEEAGGSTGCMQCVRVFSRSIFPNFLFSCFEANLNGEYHQDPLDNNYYRGIIWEQWKGDYSLKSSRMLIRSQTFLLATDV